MVQLLNPWKDCLSLHNVSIFYIIMTIISRDKMCTFSSFGYDYETKKVVLRTSLKN
jgi:hypothetical protein